LNESNPDTRPQGSDAVEALLARAMPRAAPPPEVVEEVRALIRSEWRAVAASHRRRRRLTGFAIAATVTLAVAVPLMTLHESGIAPVNVAKIARGYGAIYLQGSGPALDSASAGSIVETGQTLTTAANAGVALAWHDGGSLRIDRNTKVEVLGISEIYLHSGRVYFDSAAAANGSRLTIRTPHGVVTHTGTQYMTETTPAGLIISVREGRVEVDSARHDQTVVEGQRVEIFGDGPATVTNTSGVGAEWEWIEAVAPRADLVGKSTYEFLHWVARETGYALRFTSQSAEELARSTLLVGEIDGDPRSELRLRMMTIDLEARFDAQTRSMVVSGTR